MSASTAKPRRVNKDRISSLIEKNGMDLPISGLSLRLTDHRRKCATFIRGRTHEVAWVAGDGDGPNHTMGTKDYEHWKEFFLTDILHLSSREDAEQVFNSATAWEQHVPKQVKLDDAGVYFADKLLSKANKALWYAADYDQQGFLRVSRLPLGKPVIIEAHGLWFFPVVHRTYVLLGQDLAASTPWLMRGCRPREGKVQGPFEADLVLCPPGWPRELTGYVERHYSYNMLADRVGHLSISEVANSARTEWNPDWFQSAIELDQVARDVNLNTLPFAVECADAKRLPNGAPLPTIARLTPATVGQAAFDARQVIPYPRRPTARPGNFFTGTFAQYWGTPEHAPHPDPVDLTPVDKITPITADIIQDDIRMMLGDQHTLHKSIEDKYVITAGQIQALARYRRAEPRCSDKIRTVIQDCIAAASEDEIAAIVAALDWVQKARELEDTSFKEWLEVEWEKAIAET